ncbi:solute carrier family 22 member 23-like isoform X2 [Lethenteron reissneri]|uniref:solute carrier family 22 member 23-like isoform X2 n=2 Tax=Lethenteron reissneri TaxID=7753 RepID=UPI002AB68D5B|nr:solute carrier family 22 member 23-like isoform X2 [Lethenteron reissneri]
MRREARSGQQYLQQQQQQYLQQQQQMNGGGGGGGPHCARVRYGAAGAAAGVNRTEVGTGEECTAWVYRVSPSQPGLRTTIVTQWDLVCKKWWLVPAERLAFMVGYVVGCVAMGALSDRLGRRCVLLISLVLTSLVGFAMGLSSGPVMFTVLRLGQGLFLPGVFLSLYLILIEMCDPPRRLMRCMMAMVFLVGGEMVLPGLALLCRDWAVLQPVLATPLVLSVSLACVLGESARWLLATRQVAEARAALETIAERNGATEDEDVARRNDAFQEIECALEFASKPRKHNVLELFSTRNIWKNLLILCFITFIGSGLHLCFMQYLRDSGHSFYARYYMMAGAAAVGCLLTCVAAERMGRRGTLLACVILMGLASLLLLALTQYLVPELVLALTLLGLVVSHAAGGLGVFVAAEVTPTVVRGAGLGLAAGCASLGRVSAPLEELLTERGSFLHHVVLAALDVVALLSVMFLPESRGHPLPESLNDGETYRQHLQLSSAPGACGGGGVSGGGTGVDRAAPNGGGGGIIGDGCSPAVPSLRTASRRKRDKVPLLSQASEAGSYASARSDSSELRDITAGIDF